MATKSDWCIVALPEETNPVHKVSSEKAAHMTLLFLGEQSEPALAIRMIETLQHTIDSLRLTKFSIGVERRGILGRDQADVLFFYKDESGRARDLRDMLLKNDDFKQAYDSTEQYPEWTPHLTLGYPDRPAKPIPEDRHSISWITFDRIALWIEDSDGPEIRLNSYGPEPETVEHTDRMIKKGTLAMNEAEDFLAHYGVKGMKWGVRKRDKTPGARKAERASARQEASQAKAKAKATRSGARGAIGADLGSKFNLKTRDGKIRTGATTAGLILASPAAERYLGYELSKSAGYSTGKSAAIGFLGGTVGGLAAAEISVRKKARA